MELVMWIVVGIVAVLAFIVFVPVLVVGTWFVVMTVMLGLADGSLWLLDQGWKNKRSGRRNGKLPLLVAGLPRGKFGDDGDAVRVAQVAPARP